MGSIEHDLDLVNQPLPMRGDREDQLLAKLLDELRAGPFNTDSELGPIEFEPPIELRPDRPRRWRRRGAWHLATAAAFAILAVTVASLIDSQVTDTAQQAGDPAAEAIDSACLALATRAPTLQAISDQLAEDPPDTSGLDLYRTSFESLITAIGDLPVTDVPVQTRRQLLVIDGYLQQARLAAAQGGPSPSATLQSAQGELVRIAEHDSRFRRCST